MNEAGAGPLNRPVIVAPYGAWRSSIGLDELYAGRQVPSGARVDGHDVYWLESRPSEGGREVVVRRAPDGSVADASPLGVNVRTMVHEYGGGAWAVADRLLVYADKADGRLYRTSVGGDGDGVAPTAITPPGAYRYADLELDLARGRVLCVLEDHTDSDIEARNSLVAVPLDGSGSPVELAAGHDFFAAPRLSPDGARLAWLSWDHPNLPWDGTDLWLAELDPDGQPAAPRRVAGGPTDAITQPRWSPGGELHFVAEPDGWWNLFRLGPDGGHVPLAPASLEFGFPDWNFGARTYDFLSDGRIAAVSAGGPTDARGRLWLIDPEAPAERRRTPIDVPYTDMVAVAVLPDDRLVLVAASWSEPRVVTIVPLSGGPGEVIQRSTRVRIDPGEISIPRPISFPTTDGAIAHALFYPPRNDGFRGPEGELPPLIVTSHGGPTSAARTSLQLDTQYFTSRGLAVVDVDYRGSTGYGRDYRRALEGNWGVYDVDDCVAAARYLAEEGLVDGSRLIIEGGSASGYTTLAALAFRDDFRAGMSYFGIGNLETFVKTTHKFESRYIDRLVGPWPEAAATYRARSPVFHLERLSCPLLILQGLEDRIVPPSQAEEMVEALRAKGLACAYLAFEGEGHGFRSEASLRRATEAQLAFLGQVLGFSPADDLPPLELIGAA